MENIQVTQSSKKKICGPLSKASNANPVMLDRFIFMNHLGRGTFGYVFQAYDTKTGKHVAIKVEQNLLHGMHVNKNRLLRVEAQVMKALSDAPGFPRYIHYFEDEDYSCLAMTLLGENLHKIINRHSAFLSRARVLNIGLQSVQRLQSVHRRYLVLRDVKPENMVLRGVCLDMEASWTVNLIDFGLARMWYDPNKGIVDMETGKDFVGTTVYASLNVHRGFTATRRDDLESLAYSLIVLCTGSLPWMTVDLPDKKLVEQEIFRLKSAYLPDCHVPRSVKKLLMYSKTLKFAEDPDYSMLMSFFQKDIDRMQGNSTRGNRSVRRSRLRRQKDLVPVMIQRQHV